MSTFVGLELPAEKKTGKKKAGKAAAPEQPEQKPAEPEQKPEGEEQCRAYRAAVCAALDVDAAYGFSGGVAEGLQSMTVGSFSATLGQQDGQSAYEQDMQRAVRRELSGTGLLCQRLG